LEEIKKLRVFERFNPKTKKAFYPERFPVGKSSFRVPTLREYVELVQGLNKTLDKKVGLYPEIKNPGFHLKEGKDITLIVMNILDEYRVEKVFVQCFDPKTLKRIRKMNKTIPLIQLIGENAWFNNSIDYEKMRTEKGLQEISAYANGVGPWLKHIFKEESGKPTSFISWAHQNNLKVHPYTVRKDQLPTYVKDLKGLLQKLFKEAKADGVFTDHGLEVKEILKSL
jgi:glycerophosphoryl diester phosphodiesterase